jgi:type IV secretory pathway VirB6-like protein
VIKEDKANFGTKVWDSTTSTCKIFNNLHYKVTYASTGFTQKPQKYIVSIDQSSVASEWKFNRKAATMIQQFSLGVSFQFVELQPSEALTKGDVEV